MDFYFRMKFYLLFSYLKVFYKKKIVWLMFQIFCGGNFVLERKCCVMEQNNGIAAFSSILRAGPKFWINLMKKVPSI